MTNPSLTGCPTLMIKGAEARDVQNPAVALIVKIGVQLTLEKNPATSGAVIVVVAPAVHHHHLSLVKRAGIKALSPPLGASRAFR